MSLDAASAALLAELTAELGSARSAKRNTPVAAAVKTWTSPSGRKHTVAMKGEFPEQAARSPQDGANDIAHAEAFLAAWLAESRETWVMSQQCRCCSRTVTYIAGEYIRFKRRPTLAFGKYPVEAKDKAHIWRRTEHFPDLWLAEHELQSEVVERNQTVAQCAECLRDGTRVETLWSVLQRVIQREPNSEPELVIPGLEGVSS